MGCILTCGCFKKLRKHDRRAQLQALTDDRLEPRLTSFSCGGVGHVFSVGGHDLVSQKIATRLNAAE